MDYFVYSLCGAGIYSICIYYCHAAMNKKLLVLGIIMSEF